MFTRGGKISVGALKSFIESTYDSNTNEIKGYMLDNQLSTVHTKVFYNHAKKVLIVVERPTSDKRDVLSDVIAGLDITGMLFKKIDSRYKNSFNVYKKALTKYNQRENSILVGYSLGALVAEEFVRENPGVFSETLLVSKPVIPARVLSKLPKGTTEIRSELDAVSLLKPLQKKADRELVIKAETYNPVAEHQVKNIFPRLNQEMEVGDENIISGAGIRKKLLTEAEMKSMTVKELKTVVIKSRKLVPKELRKNHDFKVSGKSKAEIKNMIRAISENIVTRPRMKM